MEYVEVQGTRIPALGLGTWRLTGRACRNAVAMALEIGYRHIDTAQMYANEADVGLVLKKAALPRDDLFLVTKIDNDNHAGAKVRASTMRSLDDLGVDHVDLLLVHWPVQFERIAETLGAMAELQAEGRTRHLGVSNFSVSQLQEARRHATLLANQVRYHPFDRPADVAVACQAAGMTLTAYSPLAKGAVAGNPSLQSIAERLGCTPSQVALRWLLDQPGFTVIPKASSRDHLSENFGALDVSLGDEDRRRVDALA